MLIRLTRRPRYYMLLQMMPRRSPSWRWTLAQQYRETSKDPKVRRDRWVVAAAVILHRIKALTFLKFNLAVEQAISIWEANTIQRWEIESRILAKQSNRRIAHAPSLPAETILAYEKLFFDVRNHLQHRDYIAGNVLHCPAQPSCTDVGGIWNRMAYWHGPVVLESLVDHFKRRGWADYSPIIQDEPLSNRTPLDVAIERSLLLMLLPGTLTADQMVMFERAVRPLTTPKEEKFKFAPDFVHPDALRSVSDLVIKPVTVTRPTKKRKAKKLRSERVA